MPPLPWHATLTLACHPYPGMPPLPLHPTLTLACHPYPGMPPLPWHATLTLASHPYPGMPPLHWHATLSPAYIMGFLFYSTVSSMRIILTQLETWEWKALMRLRKGPCMPNCVACNSNKQCFVKYILTTLLCYIWSDAPPKLPEFGHDRMIFTWDCYIWTITIKNT